MSKNEREDEKAGGDSMHLIRNSVNILKIRIHQAKYTNALKIAHT